MRKRGISPLIAWVLLIGFSITAGLLVTRWAIDEFSNVSFPEDTDVYCDNLQLDIDEVCIDNPNNNSVRLNLSNEGSFTIKKLSIGRATTSYPMEFCTLLNLNLAPNNVIVTSFLAGSDNSLYSNIRETDCSILSGNDLFNSTHNLTKIEITPWIEIEDNDFHCIEKGITLNNILELNKFCS